ncbi:MAG: AAA family ATPase [Propionibacterium sp.]
MLIAMSGLQATGKSRLAAQLARRIGAVLVSVDPIESAMTRAGLWHNDATGLAAYYVAETVARQNLEAGHEVIVDAANYVSQGRGMWIRLAEEMSTDVVFLVTVCSDGAEHRRRVEQRRRELPGIPEVSWDDVMKRNVETEMWGSEPRLAVDTAREVDLDQLISLVRCFGKAEEPMATRTRRSAVPPARRASLVP